MLISTVLPAIKFEWWQNCVLPQAESLWWQDKRSGIIEPIHCCQTDFVPLRCHHCGVVEGIEVKLKMVIVTVRLVEGHQVLLTMTLGCTTILDFCIAQLKNDRLCHQVSRCWPHSTACRPPGHRIGRPALMVTCAKVFNTKVDLAFLAYFPEPETEPW